MKHHFRGYLAGLSVLLHKTEKPEVLSCLHKCKESLEVPAMELLEPGMELLTNSGECSKSYLMWIDGNPPLTEFTDLVTFKYVCLTQWLCYVGSRKMQIGNL
jgi:hypothetical protein